MLPEERRLRGRYSIATFLVAAKQLNVRRTVSTSDVVNAAEGSVAALMTGWSGLVVAFPAIGASVLSF
jgi:hypothetical protein